MPEVWILIDVVLNTLLQCLNLSVDKSNVGIDGLQDLLILDARLAPISFSLSVALKGHHMTNHRP